jgi:hypothetical protein
MVKNGIKVGLIEKELWRSVAGKEIYLFSFID